MPFRSQGSGVGGFGGVPASIRNNNPGAQWPGPVATQFGATGSQRIGGGNLIATFPSPVNGAAAHMALLDSRYTGMTLAQAIRKWTGSTSNPAGYIASVSKATGLQPNDIVTHDIFADPTKAIAFAQAMAGEEAGKSGTLTAEQWKQGYDMAFPGSGEPNVELALGSPHGTGNVLEINAGDTSQDPGSMSTGGDTSLGDTSLGGDLKTEFTGPEYATPTPEPTQSVYPATNSVFDAIPANDYGAPNAADQWWKADNWTTGEAAASAGAGAGGAIWSDIPAPVAGPTVTLNDASAPTIGGTASTPTALPTPTPENTVPPTGNGHPSSPIDDPRQDETGSDYPATVPDAAGFDIRNHYDTGGNNPTPREFGGDLTLGNYLNMPLWQMRFGQDHPPVDTGSSVSGGRPADLQPGEGYISQGAADITGGHWVDTPGGQTWVDDGGGNNNTYPEVRPGTAPTESDLGDGDTNDNTGATVPQGEVSVGTFGSTSGDFYEGTHFNYGTGHFNADHPSTSEFALSKNLGAEFYTARNPVRFGMNPTQEGGQNVNTFSTAQTLQRNAGTSPAQRAQLRAWSRGLSTVQQVQNRGLAQLLTPPTGGHR